jgi:hypothetical protein
LAGAEQLPKKYALLVGCTRYQNNENLLELWGPANDVPRFGDLLRKRFGFPGENITQLLGWPDDPGKRASHANIAATFEKLIARADAGTQVVILLSGHGTRVPILHPTRAQKWKANHLAFLPLDVKNWEADRLPNAILDDQLADWLGRLRGRGASVLILLDCCHAGAMTRGGTERLRSVRPQELGIPDAAIQAAVERAREGFRKDQGTGERARGAGPVLLPASLGLGPRGSGKGSLTAVYACQPFEEAPELPRPEGAPQTRDNYYGLLSYVVTTVLTQHQDRPLTYRELGQVLVARYKAERGSRGPTPLFEGDLDREVLGLKRWPGRAAIILERTGGSLAVTAGVLRGLTPGSVLAVHPPAEDRRDPKTVLGHVRVTKADPGRAEVEPCARGKTPAPPAADLPENARCELVERDFGDLRIKVAVHKPDPDDLKKDDRLGKALANVRGALDALPADVQGLIAIVPDEGAADWVLDAQGDRVVLRQGAGAAVSRKQIQAGNQTLQLLGQPIPRQDYGGYPAGDVKAIQGGLERDFQKIFTWRTLWVVAGNLDRGAGVPPGDLKLKVLTPKEGDAPGGELLDGSTVRSGQRAELQITNTGSEDYWVTIVLLDADFGIQVISRSLGRRESLKDKATIESRTFGREGVILLALPMRVSKNEPQYGFLEQEPLQKASLSRGDRTRGLAEAPQTPFGQIMKTAVRGKGTRAWSRDVPSNPQVLSWSWTTIPKQPTRP